MTQVNDKIVLPVSKGFPLMNGHHFAVVDEINLETGKVTVTDSAGVEYRFTAPPGIDLREWKVDSNIFFTPEGLYVGTETPPLPVEQVIEKKKEGAKKGSGCTRNPVDYKY